ncbi:putative reverse transcriptase domain-containing protein [Tanacetum coccineum]|uniref:Reverse transcriptase domain-containing protein n=1 Tax=Tanacetum coccineum TaxID=301880 RepID=A0ABQ5IJZ9_9ASTR
MVGTRQSTLEFSGPAFEAAVQRAVDALLPGLTTRFTNEIRQNGTGGSGDQPPNIHTWLERFGKQKPRSFSSATTPVDVENWIAHIEKIFEVLGCADELKARLASYKFEGDALNWWKAFKQAKGGETYVATLSWKDFRDIFFLQYFPRTLRTANLHNFNGTEGVVGLKRWFEKMEQVFEICKCAEDDKVKFAMCTFEGRALTWWNGNVQTLGLANANQIPWSNVKAMMTTEYCPATEIQDGARALDFDFERR